MKLLNIDQNAKTVKGQKKGYMTAVMYLAPYKSAGINLCPMAEIAGCWRGCLNTAGRGGISKGSAKMNPHGIELPDNAIQNARITRTRLWADDRPAFMAQLRKEITAFIKKAKRKGLTPVVRLNGTSDIQWERVAPELFTEFADIQFYDYTKIAKRFERKLPANYYLCLSWSGASRRYQDMVEETHRTLGASLVVVTRDAASKAEQLELGGIDGDENDLRFLDPAGAMVYLKAKGSARSDQSGFVQN